MEGSFLVRQIYEDEITYNLITAAVEVLRKFNSDKNKCKNEAKFNKNVNLIDDCD